ncbi:hypothetical protein [Burkholderia sp. ISTR5]|nr:hypothetical protein [Burkholderia sp. ISTR5]
MTSTEWFEAAGFVVLIVILLALTGIHRGIKGIDKDHRDHP